MALMGEGEEKPYGEWSHECVGLCTFCPHIIIRKAFKNLHKRKKEFIMSRRKQINTYQITAPKINNLNLVSAEQRPTLNIPVMHPIIISFKAFQPLIVQVSQSTAALREDRQVKAASTSISNSMSTQPLTML